MQLYIRSFGSKLRVHEGLFQVSCFDEHERLRSEQFAPSEVDSIWLQPGTSVSTDAIHLAMKHDIDFVILDRWGQPEGRFFSHRPNNSSLVQKAQLLVSREPRALEYVKTWIAGKISTQQAFLRKSLAHRATSVQAFVLEQIAQLETLKEKIEQLAGIDIDLAGPTIRGLEGAAGKVFYQTLGQLLPEPFRFERRSRRPAVDPFNAFLNYAFAIFYSKVERALWLAGINPYIGFLHRDGHQFKSMVYDFIEPFRVDAIRVVFRLFSRKKIKLSAHVEDRDGGIWLTHEGRRLIINAVTADFHKRVDFQGRRLTREDVILREAQQFARALVADLKVAEPVMEDFDP